MTSRTPKYHRARPEDRRADLVDATIACLAEHGQAGASVRRIAARAGVSAGLVNHHFDGIEALIAAAYEELSNQVLGRVLARVAEETEPRRRLSAYFSANFSDAVLDPGLLKVWVVFWSMLPHAEPLRRIQRRTWTDYRRSLETIIAECVPSSVAFDAAGISLGLAALMDGLWLQWGLDPGSYRPDDAVALCEAFADDAIARAVRAAE
jgi:AcrR family transcriptional regulator